MAEPPLLPPVEMASPTSNQTTIDPNPSLSHPVDLSEITIAPMQDEAVPFGRPSRSDNAMFSTMLGNRAPRSLPTDSPFPPVLVHSNSMEGVVRTAHMWRDKYPSYSLCIFPDCGWTIGHLWDEVDIHVETPTLCAEVLKFITQENYRLAINYARDWSQTHEDKLSLVAGDMRGFYDPDDHLAIVDKIFVEKETKHYPRTFLWHVLHIIRTNVLMMRRTEAAMTATDRVQALPAVDQVANKAPLIDSSRNDSVTSGTFTQSNAVASNAPGKNDRSRPFSRAHKLTLTTALWSTSKPTVPVPSGPSAPLSQPRLPPPRTSYRSSSNAILSYGSRVPSGYHAESLGHTVTGSRSGCSMVPLTMDRPALRVSKGRSGSRHEGSSAHDYSVKQGVWTENNPRTPSGPYPGQRSGSHPAAQSPHFVISNAEVGHPMVRPFHPMLPFSYNYSTMPPSMPINSLFHPGMMPQGTMPHHVQVQNPSSVHTMSHDSQGPQGPQVISFGDMANNLNYPANIVPPQMGTHGPMPRRDSQPHRGVLYDPYNGTNPSLNVPPDHYMGKKPWESSSSNQPNRPRKTSAPGNHPGYSVCTLDRQGNLHNNEHRSVDSRARGTYEDDPDIVNDLEHGCNQRWIGPKNESVLEVFVGDLPNDVSEPELQRLFEDGVGLTPAHSHIRPNFNNPRGQACAFVAFSSAADAKKALNICEEYRLLRGRPVSITVPKRFYQRPLGLLSGAYASSTYGGSSHSGPVGDRPARGRTHISAHAEESIAQDLGEANRRPMYSPQDARSDLQRKSGQPQQQDAVMNGSPEMKKPNKRQSPYLKKATGKPVISLTTRAVDNAKAMPRRSHEGSLSIAEAEPTTTNREIQSTEPQREGATKEPQLSATNYLSAGEQCSTTTVPNERVKRNVIMIASPTKQVKSGKRSSNRSSNERIVMDMQPLSVTVSSSSELPASAVKARAQSIEKQSARVKVDQAKAAEITAMELGDLQSSSANHDQHKEAGSEDDQQHEISSHFTHELQSHIISSESHRNELMSAHHGTVSVPADVGPRVQRAFPSATTVLKQVKAESAPPSSSKETQEASTVTATIATTEKSIKEPVMSEGNMDMVEIPAPIPLVDATLKRSGTQHTPSLHPFAKPNKSQRQKEKEQRKKEEKKKRAEQTEKAKAEKVSASTKPIEIVHEKSDKEEPLASVIESSEPDVQTVATGKRKVLAKETGEEASTSIAVENGKTKDSDKHAGKQASGTTTTNPLKEMDSMTEKTEAQAATAADAAKNGFLSTPSSTIAQSSEQASAPVGHTLLDSTAKSDGPQMSQTNKGPVPGTSTLTLHSHGPPPLSESSQVNSPTTPFVSKATQSDTMASGPIHKDLASALAVSHAASEAGSMVLQSEIEGLAQPSPTASTFHTPMQTPVRQDGTEEGDESKKKKKRKPKKKKAKPAEGPDDSGMRPEVVDGSSNSFNQQLGYIEAIKEATMDKEHYYARSNAEAPARAEKAGKIEAMKAANKLTEPGMIRSIEDYFIDKKANSVGAKLSAEDLC